MLGRERLFELINEQPTCFEVVSGKAKQDFKPKKRGLPGAPRPGGPPPKAYRPVKAPENRVLVDADVTNLALLLCRYSLVACSAAPADPEARPGPRGRGGRRGSGRRICGWRGRPVPELWAHLQVRPCFPGTRAVSWSSLCTLIVLFSPTQLVRARLNAGCRPGISVFAHTASS